MMICMMLLAALAAPRSEPPADTRETTRLLMEFASRGSASGDAAGVKAASEWVASRFRGIGFQVRELQEEGNPLLFAERRVDHPALTVLFYMHYDTQPIGPAEDWASTGGEAFRPRLMLGQWDETGARPIELEQLDERTIETARLYARGAADDKAPIVMHLRAMRQWLSNSGAARVHLKYLLDGEEESGSVHIASALARHRETLRADLVVLCDGPMDAQGRPSVYLGARGDMHMRLTLRTARLPAHSGNYGLLPNAAWRLSSLLATMKDAQGRVTVDGLFDGVVPPTDAEKRTMAEASLAEPVIARTLGVAAFEGDAAVSYYERLLFSPTLIINQLSSGRPGNQIPVVAEALLEVRLVTRQEPEQVYEAIRRHVAARMPAASLEYLDGTPAARMDPGEPYVARAIQAASHAAGRQVLVYPSLGGTLPLLNALGAAGHKYMGLPLVNFDNNQHVGNENVKVSALRDGVVFLTRFLDALAQ